MLHVVLFIALLSSLCQTSDNLYLWSRLVQAHTCICH